jgi:hypothetical protein
VVSEKDREGDRAAWAKLNEEKARRTGKRSI